MWKCPKCGRSFSREGQGHYCGKIETVDQYIEEQDETVRPYLNEVRQIIRSAIPDAQEKISWSMPTYWKAWQVADIREDVDRHCSHRRIRRSDPGNVCVPPQDKTLVFPIWFAGNTCVTDCSCIFGIKKVA